MGSYYIYNLPFKDWDNLVKILNCGDSWRELGGYQLGYSTVQLDHFASWIHKPGGSPADAMLKDWGRGNRTTKELFKHLKNMGHYQAMDALKNFVPEKYHTSMQPTSTYISSGDPHQTTPKRIGISNTNLAMALPPPPPINFELAHQNMESNLDVEDKKLYVKNVKPVYEIEDSDTLSSNDQFTELNHSPTTLPLGHLLQPKSKPIPANTSTNRAMGTLGSVSNSAGKSSVSLETRMRHVSGRDKIPIKETMLGNIPYEELFNACHG